MGYRASAEDDTRVKRFSALIDRMADEVDFDKLSKEIDTLHAVRTVQLLRADDPNFKEALLRANIQDQSNRSRLTKIQVEMTTLSSRVSVGLSRMTDYLLVKFDADLAAFRTKEQRVRVAQSLPVYTKAQKLQVQADLVYECAGLVITDIDKAHYSLKLNKEILELTVRRENML